MDVMVDVGGMSVNDVIRRYPDTVEVFNRHGIDACCGGAASVSEAADRDGADVTTLLEELQRVIAGAA